MATSVTTSEAMPSGMSGIDSDSPRPHMQYDSDCTAAYIVVGVLIPTVFLAVCLLSCYVDRRRSRARHANNSEDIELGRIYDQFWFPWRAAIEATEGPVAATDPGGRASGPGFEPSKLTDDQQLHRSCSNETQVGRFER